MKKFLIIACAVMLCCVMLLPVSAEDNTYNFNGVVLPLPDEVPTEFLDTAHELEVRWALYELPYSSQKVLVLCPGYWYLHNAHIQYVGDGIVEATLIYYSSDAVSKIDFQEVDNGDSFFLWSAIKVNEIASNFHKFVCDGSACPATDVNTDNICDDCGMVFAVLRDYPIPDPYLVFTTEYQTRFPYAFIYKGENNTYHMIFSAFEPIYFNGAVVVENNDDDLSYLKYSVNGDTWKYDGGFSDGADIVTDTVYPSFNMNDLDGNLAYKQNTDFFPIPLWVEMDNLTQGEMIQFSPTVVGILMTLTVCGVGCLALLVVLKLFGKRSLLFRK